MTQSQHETKAQADGLIRSVTDTAVIAAQVTEKPRGSVGHEMDLWSFSLCFHETARSYILRCHFVFSGQGESLFVRPDSLNVLSRMLCWEASMSEVFWRDEKHLQINWLYGGKSNPSEGYLPFQRKDCTWVQFKRITSGGGCATKECRRWSTGFGQTAEHHYTNVRMSTVCAYHIVNTVNSSEWENCKKSAWEKKTKHQQLYTAAGQKHILTMCITVQYVATALILTIRRYSEIWLMIGTCSSWIEA